MAEPVGILQGRCSFGIQCCAAPPVLGPLVHCKSHRLTRFGFTGNGEEVTVVPQLFSKILHQLCDCTSVGVGFECYGPTQDIVQGFRMSV